MKFRQIISVPHENIEKYFRFPLPEFCIFAKKSKISQILDKKVKIVNINSLQGFNDVRPYTIQIENDRGPILQYASHMQLKIRKNKIMSYASHMQWTKQQRQAIARCEAHAIYRAQR